MSSLARALGLFALVAAGARAGAAPTDRGIYPELSAPVEAALGSAALRDEPGARVLRVDRARGLATLFVGRHPRKVYALPLADAARAELAAQPYETRDVATVGPDHDGDGIVDRLDVLRGAKKLLLNRAAYHARYARLPYPGGDVPRTEGVCTDTVIRALRNAGIDLQREVFEDLRRARASYPMVERVDASINHRRVKTLRAWLARHFTRVPVGAGYEPGDVVLFDTFPDRPGAEHIGIVSDTLDPRGVPLVINNWTDGTVDAEMPLLGAIGVTDHFRAPD